MNDFDARRASLELVTAFVNNNKLTAGELPTLLSDVYKAISGFEVQPAARASVTDAANATAERSEPASSDETETKDSAAPAAPLAARKIKLPSARRAGKTPRAHKPVRKDSRSGPDFMVSFVTGEKYPILTPDYSRLRRSVAHSGQVQGEGIQAAGEPVVTFRPETTGEALPSAKTEPAQKTPAATKKPRATRKPRAMGAASAKRGRTKSETKPATGDAAPRMAEKPVQALNEGVPASAGPVPLAEPVKVDEPAGKAPSEKRTRKRRMARQPAAETTPSDAAAIPARVKAGRAEGAKLDASPKAKAGKSKKTGSAPATIHEANAKPARKERKKLSPVFG